MKCPLSITGELTADKEFIGAAADCLKEECAWWSEELNQCDPTGLLPWIKRVAEALEHIAGRMPKDLAPGR